MFSCHFSFVGISGVSGENAGGEIEGGSFEFGVLESPDKKDAFHQHFNIMHMILYDYTINIIDLNGK